MDSNSAMFHSIDIRFNQKELFLYVHADIGLLAFN